MPHTLGIALTGHRPNKLAGYDMAHPFYTRLHDVLVSGLVRNLAVYDRLVCHSGLALGADTIWSRAILNVRAQYGAQRVGFVAHVPCPHQAQQWTHDSQREWRHQCENADQTVFYAPTYTRTCMQDRNIGMVTAAVQESASLLLAIWDGTNGGTANCVRYAETMTTPSPVIQIIRPERLR